MAWANENQRKYMTEFVECIYKSKTYLGYMLRALNEKSSTNFDFKEEFSKYYYKKFTWSKLYKYNPNSKDPRSDKHNFLTDFVTDANTHKTYFVVDSKTHLVNDAFRSYSTFMCMLAILFNEDIETFKQIKGNTIIEKINYFTIGIYNRPFYVRHTSSLFFVAILDGVIKVDDNTKYNEICEWFENLNSEIFKKIDQLTSNNAIEDTGSNTSIVVSQLVGYTDIIHYNKKEFEYAVLENAHRFNWHQSLIDEMYNRDISNTSEYCRRHHAVSIENGILSKILLKNNKKFKIVHACVDYSDGKDRFLRYGLVYHRYVFPILHYLGMTTLDDIEFDENANITYEEYIEDITAKNDNKLIFDIPENKNLGFNDGYTEEYLMAVNNALSYVDNIPYYRNQEFLEYWYTVEKTLILTNCPYDIYPSYIDLVNYNSIKHKVATSDNNCSFINLQNYLEFAKITNETYDYTYFFLFIDKVLYNLTFTGSKLEEVKKIALENYTNYKNRYLFDNHINNLFILASQVFTFITGHLYFDNYVNGYKKNLSQEQKSKYIHILNDISKKYPNNSNQVKIINLTSDILFTDKVIENNNQVKNELIGLIKSLKFEDID